MRLFRLDETGHDLQAMQDLQATVRAREAARQDQSATESLKFLRDLLANDLRLAHLTGEARRGRLAVALMSRSIAS